MRFVLLIAAGAFTPGTMVSIVLAMGGVEVVVSRTKVSPEAIELSVIHADDAVERAWKWPAAASFRHILCSLCEAASWVERTDKGACFCFEDLEAKTAFVSICQNFGVQHLDG
jgi:hypothetical protein